MCTGLVLLMSLWGCGSSSSPSPDAGTVPDGGVEDAGSGDGGSGDDGGTTAALPCEKTRGVCAGAKRALVDGAYEPVCTARSYGADYEETESRCDGLDNDCDGVVDPPTWSRITELGSRDVGWREASILRTSEGLLVSVPGLASEGRIFRLDSQLRLQGTERVPAAWEPPPEGRTNIMVSSSLVRTAEGPAFYYSTGEGSPTEFRAYLAPLDESGRPGPLPEGTVRLMPDFKGPTTPDGAWIGSRVKASSDGQRLLVVWRQDLVDGNGRQVWGAVFDARGQIVTAPRVLFTSEAVDSYVWLGDALWLRNGEVAIAIEESKDLSVDTTLRLGRFDERLERVGDERRFPALSSSTPLLVDLGAARGGALDSPVLVFRGSTPPDTEGHTSLRGFVVEDLFGQGQPQSLLAVPRGETLWYSALVEDGQLSLAWISRAFVLQEDGSYLHWGRLWTRQGDGADVEQTPPQGPLPMLFTSQWVLQERLDADHMGALVLTRDGDKRFLDGVRYCAP
ncbi:putative metal-binding motif-containing protein [Myxococcus stipitatus]|uniref:putative metal-binding motif-containing protein n=1 Tax=Myxococcus stipitatus TaxID=83455 RepID=UPI001F2374EA|nr:putative metal-binding motif-containing protein [Myxococcus stipitatus]MCE9671782.1 putative metal-binding motif-containing protein [Myxococcus stipitatus]